MASALAAVHRQDWPCLAGRHRSIRLRIAAWVVAFAPALGTLGWHLGTLTGWWRLAELPGLGCALVCVGCMGRLLRSGETQYSLVRDEESDEEVEYPGVPPGLRLADHECAVLGVWIHQANRRPYLLLCGLSSFGLLGQALAMVAAPTNLAVLAARAQIFWPPSAWAEHLARHRMAPEPSVALAWTGLLYVILIYHLALSVCAGFFFLQQLDFLRFLYGETWPWPGHPWTYPAYEVSRFARMKQQRLTASERLMFLGGMAASCGWMLLALIGTGLGLVYAWTVLASLGLRLIATF